MSLNVIDFQTEVQRRRHVQNEAAKPNEHQYIIELEHEILELQQQVCALHRDLERARGSM